MTSARTLALCCALAFVSAFTATAQTAEKSLGSYSYDDSGNVTSIGPDAAGLTNYYNYDSAGRLIQFTRKVNATSPAVLTETYEYDAYGNQTKHTTNGTVQNLAASTSTNRLTAATYDAAGNMTAYDGIQYSFDPVGTLTQKSGSWGSAFYIYTADDERIAIEGPDSTWRYSVRDFDGKVLREWAASTWNGSLRWVEDYVYRDGQLAAAERPSSQGGIRHFHLDHLGTPRLITGTDGRLFASHDYYPFGREMTDPIQEMSPPLGFDTPEPMKFTGHERDFAGSFAAPPLDYMHARYYAPHAGRFSAPDPSPRSMLTFFPQTWNRFSYVINSPVVYSDPTGRAGGCVFKNGVLHCDTDVVGSIIRVGLVRPRVGNPRRRIAHGPKRDGEREDHGERIAGAWHCFEEIMAPAVVGNSLILAGGATFYAGGIAAQQGAATIGPSVGLSGIVVAAGALGMAVGAAQIGAGISVNVRHANNVFNTLLGERFAFNIWTPLDAVPDNITTFPPKGPLCAH